MIRPALLELALDLLELEAAGGTNDTHLLNLFCRYGVREARQPGGLLAAGAQPRRRRLVAVGEVLPGDSGHRWVHGDVARRGGCLMTGRFRGSDTCKQPSTNWGGRIIISIFLMN